MFPVSALPHSSEILGNLDPAAVAALDKQAQVFRYDEEGAGVKFFPGDSDDAEVYSVHSKLNPEVMVEALYSIPYPEGFDPETQDIRRRLFELAHDVTSISGVKYFSERKNKYAVLFTDAYAVNNAEDRRKIRNPVTPADKDSDTVYMNIKENLLGRGYYRMDLGNSGDMLTISLTNESSLGFFFKAVNEQELKIVLHFIPCSDRILAYGYSGVILQGDAFVNFLLDPYYAFYRRMTALENWLYNSLHGTEELPPLFDPMP